MSGGSGGVMGALENFNSNMGGYDPMSGFGAGLGGGSEGTKPRYRYVKVSKKKRQKMKRMRIREPQEEGNDSMFF